MHTRSTSFGTSGRCARGRGIWPNSTAASVERVSVPTNSRWPTSISHSMMPTANRSLRPSSGMPLACSGLMYAGLPLMNTDAVASLAARAFAMPKSDTLIEPSHDSSTLCGDTSRWTTPRTSAPTGRSCA